jgi:hypothetical protein
MSICDLILRRLDNDGACTLPQLLALLPELSEHPNGHEILHLLLRLDRRLCQLDDGRWTRAVTPQTAEERIVETAKSYLSALPGSGAMLSSLVTHVVAETQYDQAKVHSIIQRRFVTRGRIVLNQLKETL